MKKCNNTAEQITIASRPFTVVKTLGYVRELLESYRRFVNHFIEIAELVVNDGRYLNPLFNIYRLRMKKP